ncbi:MAG: SpoIIE family protein phosphatase [Cyclobacteriaceae bacterium]
MHHHPSSAGENTLADFIPDSFVIDKPLSAEGGGDRYWLHKKGKTVYLAIFDCMGNGHLARMASRIYINALSKVIAEIGIEYTGSILQYVHREIQSKFAGKEETQISTGADLAILKIESDLRIIEYAGAKIDLFVVENDEVRTFKSDRMQVGDLFDFRHQYNSNTIKINEEQKPMFYLTTDGAKDLNGGPEDRKIGITDFKNLMLKNYHHKMEDQQLRFNTYLEEWQGGRTQPDDILIIGFKI